MAHNVRLAFLILFSILLFVVCKIVTGSWLPPSDATGIWFQSGLLLVVLGSFFIEFYFTKPMDVVSNGTAAMIALLALSDRRSFVLWKVAMIYTILTLILAILSIALWKTDESIGRLRQQLARISYTVSTFFGKAELLFSIIFVLAIFSYFSTQSEDFLILAGFWGLVVITKPLGLPKLVETILTAVRGDEEMAIGEIFCWQSPNLLLAKLNQDTSISTLDPLIFKARTSDSSTGLGLTLDCYTMEGKKWAKVYIIDDSINVKTKSDESLDKSIFKQTSKIFRLSKNAISNCETLQNSPIWEQREKIVGIVADGSDIAQLKFEITAEVELEQGHILKSIVNGIPTFYQITNGITRTEILEEKNKHGFIQGIAQQIGTWDNLTFSFKSVGWVPVINSLVFLEQQAHDFDRTNLPYQTGKHMVGIVPNSTFPLYLDLDKLVTHHAAILGITGCGKTCLAYELIEALITHGVKVLCLDITGEYQVCLESSNPQDVSKEQIESFLQDDETNLGIIVPSAESTTLANDARQITEKVLNWVKANYDPAIGQNPSAKICVVYEEAHSLIPEWNSVSVKGDEQQVNATSKAILQGRKYGLGCIVITQRTANITKTILNQCNTIFGMQSFDQTGLDFLKNYIGENYATALSTLLTREGVVFGMATSSQRPVIVEFNERDFSKTREFKAREGGK